MSSPETIRGIEIEKSARNNKGEFIKEMCGNKAEGRCGVCEKEKDEKREKKMKRKRTNTESIIHY